MISMGFLLIHIDAIYLYHSISIPGLVNEEKAIEAMAIEIVDLPINSMVIFQFVM